MSEILYMPGVLMVSQSVIAVPTVDMMDLLFYLFSSAVTLESSDAISARVGYMVIFTTVGPDPIRPV